jgi:hypothetical protein
MLEGYITPSKDTLSRSGLYANGLPGVTLQLLDDLTKDEQEDFEEFWEDIYQRAIINFIADIQALLSDKFLVDLQLVSRETSKFGTDLNNSGLNSGIKINYRLPRYGIMSVSSVEVYSDSVQSVTFYFNDKDENGRLLKTVIQDLVVGLNVINIDTNFTVDELYINYDASLTSLYATENKYYDDYLVYDTLSCSFPCYTGSGNGSVTQINGGGFNVIFNATCSVSKVIEQNINIFKDALWYKIGQELIFERIHSDRFNRWTTLTIERAQQLGGNYDSWVAQKEENAVKSLRMREDPICFSCKSIVSQTYQLP